MIPDIEHTTDGALRVARRQLLQAVEKTAKVNNRLELDDNGDFTREGVVNKVTGAEASMMQSVDLIEQELRDRNAEFKNKNKVFS